MNKISTICVSSVLMLSLAGCADMSKQDVGVLSGGAIGGALGSLFGSGSGKILAAVGGTVVGALIGGSIGKSMDRQDQRRVYRALDRSRDHHVTRWHNPNNGNEYWVEPTRTYYQSDQPCRDYTTHAIIGGKKETIYGKACRKADGTWKVVG